MLSETFVKGETFMIEQLVTYAREGNLDEFRKLLYREPDLINQTTDSGESPLIAALYNGKMEIVDYLLEKGISVTIHEAAALGDDQTIGFLLDYEPKLITEYSYDGWTALHLAAFFGAQEAVQLLLDRGADLYVVSQNHLQNLPIHAAAAAKRSAIVLMLLEKGCDVNRRQKNGQTLLHMAVSHYDLNMVRMLLDFGADGTIRDDFEHTPLDIAKANQFDALVSLLKREERSDQWKMKGEIRYLDHFFMPELNELRTIRIYLPPGYDETQAIHYPVIYMHDGQNLFDSATSTYGMIWDVARTVETLMEQHNHGGWIVVGIDNNQEGLGRYAEYSPWESEIVKKYLDKTKDNDRVGGDGFAYLDFIVHTLKPYIDKYYRTQTTKDHTVIGGSSMGGFISIAAAFAYPDVFGKIIACSTAVFFEEEQLIDYIKNAEKSDGQRIYMDIGTNETSNSTLAEFPALYVDSNRRLYEALLAKGYQEQQDVLYVIEEGAEHNELAWAKRLPQAIKWLFQLA